MFADHDFEVARQDRPYEEDLIQDLDLTTLWNAMARGNAVVWASCRTALLASLQSVEDIHYRQSVFLDCLRHPAVIEELYELSVQAIEVKKKSWRGIGISSRSGEPLLRDSVKELESYVTILKHLHQIATDHTDDFGSSGFQAFFATLGRELDDAYFEEIARHLRNLRFRDGVLASAQLGEASQGVGYVLRAAQRRGNFLRRPMMKGPTYSHTISRDDEAGHEALAGLRNRVLSLAANALAQSADHIIAFFTALQCEIAFYLGCLNLQEELVQRAQQYCLPDPEPLGSAAYAATGLYDPCLALHTNEGVVGNDLHADGKDLVIVTGANQGGKSTFLRSLGVAQLMMQAGMPVAGQSFTAAIRSGVFTHFSREEDASMTSGKFDEELRRMSEISKEIRPHGFVLFNESFSATSEREGSEVATEIVRALRGADIRIAYVTHLYEFSHHFHSQLPDSTLFLRAERGNDGARPFRISEGEPLPTSFSADLYRASFGDLATIPNGGAQRRKAQSAVAPTSTRPAS